MSVLDHHTLISLFTVVSVFVMVLHVVVTRRLLEATFVGLSVPDFANKPKNFALTGVFIALARAHQQS